MNIFFDMDGVLAIYDPKDYSGKYPKWDQLGAHYFLDRKPDKRALKMLKLLDKYAHETDGKVYVLSSVSNLASHALEQGADKRAWLEKHAPFLDQFQIFITPSLPKWQVAKKIRGTSELASSDILIDDYNKNLEEWREAGGTALKYMNGTNSEESWSGIILDESLGVNDLVKMLESWLPFI